MLLEPNPGISIQATSLQSVTLMLNFMHVCHLFEISRIIHLHETSMCGTDSVSWPSIFIGIVMNPRPGRGKSALGPQKLPLRGNTGDKMLVLRMLVVTRREQWHTLSVAEGVFWGIHEVMENKRVESYSIVSLAGLKLLRSCEKSQAHLEMVEKQ